MQDWSQLRRGEDGAHRGSCREQGTRRVSTMQVRLFLTLLGTTGFWSLVEEPRSVASKNSAIDTKPRPDSRPQRGQTTLPSITQRVKRYTGFLTRQHRLICVIVVHRKKANWLLMERRRDCILLTGFLACLCHALASITAREWCQGAGCNRLLLYGPERLGWLGGCAGV